MSHSKHAQAQRVEMGSWCARSADRRLATWATRWNKSSVFAIGRLDVYG
jgi:hypothetical protein